MELPVQRLAQYLTWTGLLVLGAAMLFTLAIAPRLGVGGAWLDLANMTIGGFVVILMLVALVLWTRPSKPAPGP